MKRSYNYGTVAVIQPKRVARTVVAIARSKKRGYYSTAAQRYAASYGRPGLLGIRPGVTRTSGFYGRYNGNGGNEIKFFDTALSFNVDNTGEVPATGQLTLIPQGVTQSTRVGRKCTITSIQIRASVVNSPGASTAGATICYIWLVLDTQANGAAAAITDVFTTNDPQSALINMANSMRFKIMKRWTFDLNSQSGVTTAYNPVARHIDYYKKCSLPVEYSSTTGAITEIRSNNLFLLAGAVGPGTSDDTVGVNGACRLRYAD